MSRVDARAYDAAQDAQPGAIRGPVEVRAGIEPRGEPVGGRLKRVTDVVLAGASLLLLAPMFLLIAALLRFGLGRAVLTAQPRVGFAGRRFTAYKFSSLPTDGMRQPTGESHLAACAVGLLRDSRLDRLPELISVLRGDMSFVGPRPVQVNEACPPCPDYFAARPGLVDVFRINRTGRLGDRRRAAMDRYYARRWAIRLDFAALMRSLRDAS
jgi:exopolysaccharide production protein ExoY